MSEQLKVAAGDNCTDVSNIDEFYVGRINWLITIGRSDLIDEIADDCERRRTALHPAGGGYRPAQARTTCSTPAAHRSVPNARAATPARDRVFADDNTVVQPGERHNLAHEASVAVRPPDAVHDGRRNQAGAGVAGLQPRPVETGTRLAVAMLRRTLRPAYRHMPESSSIHA